jgi:hypothetical protein
MLLAQLFGILAFNVLGGMNHIAGSICLFSLLSNVTVPEVAHVLALQPGDYNLPSSMTTAAVLMVFYLCVYLAANVAMAFSTPDPLFDRTHFTSFEERLISWVAPILGYLFLGWTLIGHVEVTNGGFAAFVNHFSSMLYPLSVVMATHLSLKQSEGKVAMDASVAVILVAATLPGILYASKEGMLVPIFCWLSVCAAYRYRFTTAKALVLAGALALYVLVIYPYSQFARGAVRGGLTLNDKVSAIQDYATNSKAYVPGVVHSSNTESEFGESAFANNIVARYSMLRVDALLIDGDRSKGFTGIEPHLPVFYLVIPHFLWPDRPEPITGNTIAHEIGFGLDKGDFKTGIAFGSPGLFYDVSGWLGLAVLTLLEFAFFFISVRFLVGKSTQSLWGLILIGSTANAAGTLGPSDIIATLINFMIVFYSSIIALKVFSWLASILLAKKTA